MWIIIVWSGQVPPETERPCCQQRLPGRTFSFYVCGGEQGRQKPQQLGLFWWQPAAGFLLQALPPSLFFSLSGAAQPTSPSCGAGSLLHKGCAHCEGSISLYKLLVMAQFS